MLYGLYDVEAPAAPPPSKTSLRASAAAKARVLDASRCHARVVAAARALPTFFSFLILNRMSQTRATPIRRFWDRPLDVLPSPGAAGFAALPRSECPEARPCLRRKGRMGFTWARAERCGCPGPSRRVEPAPRLRRAGFSCRRAAGRRSRTPAPARRRMTHGFNGEGAPSRDKKAAWPILPQPGRRSYSRSVLRKPFRRACRRATVDLTTFFGRIVSASPIKRAAPRSAKVELELRFRILACPKNSDFVKGLRASSDFDHAAS